MKRSIIIGVLFLFIMFETNGQWYYEKYEVQTIEMLSDSQLNEALSATNASLRNSALILGAGALIAAGYYFLKPGMSDDPGILEQAIGDEGMNIIWTALGLGLAAGGGIACIDFGTRRGQIKAEIRNRNIYASRLNISPTLISINQKRFTSPGLKLTLTF